MRILRLDLRNDTVKLRIDDLDDLWTIYNTVQPGDLALARTMRRERLEIDNSRPDRGEKKPVYLGIRVEKVEFHRYVNAVRLIGRIERGIDMGSFHTLNLEPGSVFTLVRKWKDSEISNLKEAVRESRRPLVLVVSLEEGEATLAVVRQRGIDFLDEISANIPGKREPGARDPARKRFFAEVIRTIGDVGESRGIDNVLIVGPELTRNALKEFAEDGRQLPPGIHLAYDTCYSPGRPGVYEALRRGSVERVIQSNRVSEELASVEELLALLAQGGPATYGVDQVARAVSLGAVQRLLITDRFFRERRDRADALIRKAESYAGKHLIVSTDHEGGTKLGALGGIAAALRYALPEE